jgi:nickel-dependent lactate racemase
VKIELAYGREGLEIDLPDGLNVDVVRPKHIEGLTDQRAAIEEVLLRPTNARPLREMASGASRVGIVVNDVTRPTPYKIILPVLLRELQGVPDEHILFLTATGTHRPDTEAELREMLGDAVVDRYRVVQNDARDPSLHKLVGTTGSGNAIWLHRAYLECDVRILTGFIEPHFFAGFSGGGKAVMPGLALLESVLRNHDAKKMDHPKATWAVTYGNPIWEEIQEAASLASPSFLLNVTLNRNREITGVFAGDFREAYDQGCTAVKQSAMVAVGKPYDVVVTCNSGYPLDLNLYQSVKGISAAAQIVKDGGAIIAVADCWDGIPDHGRYGELLREAESPESLLRTIRGQGFARQDMWQAQIHALICLRADVYFHSRNLSDSQIESAFFRPCSSVERTIAELLHKYGPDARICVLPEGPQVVPYISRAGG